MWGVITFILFSFRLLRIKTFYWYLILLLLVGQLLFLKYSQFCWIKYYKYFFQLDNLNFVFILLRVAVLILIVVLKKKKNYKFCFYLLVFILIMFFRRKNIFYLYFFFELRLVPILFIIVQWGLKPERLNAGFYMAIYTLLGSLPLLIGVMILYKVDKESVFIKFLNGQFSLSIYSFKAVKRGLRLLDRAMFIMDSYWFLMLMSFGFLIKLPLFGLHLWLTKAHVEATTEGSMILARVLLKLGVFGILRVSELFLIKRLQLSYILVWAALSLIVVSLICFRNIDLKLLVAYSSVVHMGVLVLVFYRKLKLRNIRCLIVSVAHGVTSSLLFYIVGKIYLLRGSRRLTIKKALSVLRPLLIYLWVGALMYKMNFPPSIKFFGEIYSFLFVIKLKRWLIWLVLLTVFFGGLFKIYVFMGLRHGKRRQKTTIKLNRVFFYLIILIHLVLNATIISWWVWF